MDNRSPSMLKSTLFGGLAFGTAGALPFVSALNCACCALVVGAGFLAAFLYSNECKKTGVPFTLGGGATVGLVAGAFYALTTVVVSGVLNMILRTDIAEIIEQLEDSGVEIPPEAESWIQFFTSANPFLLLLLGFFFWLLVAAVFSTLGGVIGGAVFKVEPPAAPDRPAPPAPMQP